MRLWVRPAAGLNGSPPGFALVKRDTHCTLLRSSAGDQATTPPDVTLMALANPSKREDSSSWVTLDRPWDRNVRCRIYSPAGRGWIVGPSSLSRTGDAMTHPKARHGISLCRGICRPLRPPDPCTTAVHTETFSFFSPQLTSIEYSLLHPRSTLGHAPP